MSEVRPCQVNRVRMGRCLSSKMNRYINRLVKETQNLSTHLSGHRIPSHRKQRLADMRREPMLDKCFVPAPKNEFIIVKSCGVDTHTVTTHEPAKLSTNTRLTKSSME